MIISQIRKTFIYKGEKEGCRILVKITLPHIAGQYQLNDLYSALCEKYKSCARKWIESCQDREIFFLTVNYEETVENDTVKIKRLSRLCSGDRTLFEKYSIDKFSDGEYKILA